jgi:TIR domain-containing protein
VPRRNEPKQYLVFVSYSHQDRWIAKQCAKLVEEAGKGRIKVFLDEKDIEGGQSVAEAIRDSIKRCDEFLVLLSPSSRDRPSVLMEMGAAWGLTKPIIAIIDKLGPNEIPRSK